MIQAFVADCSVTIAWAVPSQSSKATDGLLDHLAAGTTLIVPVLWFFEVANTLIVLTRRKKLSRESCDRARSMLAALAPVADTEGAGVALHATSSLADRYSLSVYDAAYLELALRRGIPLATSDAALASAARQANTAVLL